MGTSERESNLIEAIEKSRTPEYWKNNKLWYLRRTIKVLEEIFDIPLCMSDKMKINHYVSQIIEEQMRTPISLKLAYPYHIGPELAAKFLMENYGIRDIDRMQKIIYFGKGRLAFNRMLKESSNQG